MEDLGKLKGLTLDIYRPARGDCSNGGISSRLEQVVVVGVVMERGGGRSELRPFPASAYVPSEPSEDTPAVVVVKRRMGHKTLLHVEPLAGPGEGTPWMAGGCYVATSDSRLRELLGADEFYGALSFHDRTETWAQYDALTRD